LPLWARSSGLELVPSANGGPVGGLPLVGGPLPVPCVGGLREGQGKPVSSPLAGGSPLVATLDASKGPNVQKAPSVTREPVLIWRQNSRPWNVRFLGNLVSHNGTKLATVLDASLESWLKLFREDLRARIRT
jgi:hypothetical protein